MGSGPATIDTTKVRLQTLQHERADGGSKGRHFGSCVPKSAFTGLNTSPLMLETEGAAEVIEEERSKEETGKSQASRPDVPRGTQTSAEWRAPREEREVEA